MCRHLGYLGPVTSVGEVMTRGQNSLYRQSWAPRDMRGGGTINADGFGAAWWRFPQGEPQVSRYRNPAPIWTDPAVTEVLGQVESSAVLAAVRSATTGMPVERSACSPFTAGRWALSHNGVIPNWREVLPAVAAELFSELYGPDSRFPAESLLHAEALTDSAALWVVLYAALQRLGDPHTTCRSSTAPGCPESAPQEHADAVRTADAWPGTTDPPAPKRGAFGEAVAGPRLERRSGAAFAGDAAIPRVERRSEAVTGIGAAPWAGGPPSGLAPRYPASDDVSAHGPSVAGQVQTGGVPDPGMVLSRLVALIARRVPAAKLNLLLSDGATLWATAWQHSLSALVTEESALLASEPLDADPRWQAVAEYSMVCATPGRLTRENLDPGNP